MPERSRQARTPLNLALTVEDKAFPQAYAMRCGMTVAEWVEGLREAEWGREVRRGE